MDSNTKQCSCGRSTSGLCNGSHNLTNEQYFSKALDQQKLIEKVLLKEAK